MKLRLTRLGAACFVAAYFVAAAVVALTAAAQAAPRIGQRISVTGCLYAGVTASCLMVNGADGATYNITAITPRPRSLRRMIWLRGTVSERPSICSQGVVLDRIRWTRTRQICPN